LTILVLHTYNEVEHGPYLTNYVKRVLFDALLYYSKL